MILCAGMLTAQQHFKPTMIEWFTSRFHTSFYSNTPVLTNPNTSIPFEKYDKTSKANTISFCTAADQLCVFIRDPKQGSNHLKVQFL